MNAYNISMVVNGRTKSWQDVEGINPYDAVEQYVQRVLSGKQVSLSWAPRMRDGGEFTFVVGHPIDPPRGTVEINALTLVTVRVEVPSAFTVTVLS